MIFVAPKNITDLQKEFPEAGLLSFDPSELKEYGKDWTKVYQPDPLAIAFPKNTQEVSRLLKFCHTHKIPVVPSGGRTGLAGGAVAAQKELVISLKRMNKMEPVDTLSQTVRVQAGVVTEAVHEYCSEAGLTWPVDFASKGSSHVGGNIATNAGGVNVIRYGLTRHWVLGLQVVLATGEVLELNGALEKNNTGIDLRQVFIGSEGTLGIITEATLKLTKLPGEKSTFLFSVNTLDDVLTLFEFSRKAAFTLQAYEFFTQYCLSKVNQHLNARVPFEKPCGHYVLLEVEKPQDETILEEFLEKVFEKKLVTDGLMAQSPAQAREFWVLREGIAESLFATGLPHKNDVALPIKQLHGFCSELEKLFTQKYPGWDIANFGHIGDGNLHLNIMKPQSLSKEEFLKRTHDVDHDLFTLVKKYQGSISAEHGIGLLKKDFLDYSRSAKEIELFRQMKKVFDPHGILNPGKVF